MKASTKLFVREIVTGVIVACVVSVAGAAVTMWVTIELVKAKNNEQDAAINGTADALLDLRKDVDGFKVRVGEKLEQIGKDTSYIRGLLEPARPLIGR